MSSDSRLCLTSGRVGLRRCHPVEPVPFETFLAAAKLLYEGGLVAERHAAVGAFVDEHRDQVDPTVGAIISAAGTVRATEMVADLERLEQLRAESMAVLDGFDALLVPTAPGHPTIEEVAAGPVEVNAWMGTYTNFCNLIDLCAVAVPAGTVEGPDGTSQFGVTVVARTFHDAVALDLARRVAIPADSVAQPGAAPAPPATSVPWPVSAGAPCVELFVVGAHLIGQPLEHQLRSCGARWAGPASTSEEYALVALDTSPPKPGLIRVGHGGSSIIGEIWQLSTGALGGFLAHLPTPMNLGAVQLSDGRVVVGFGCDAASAGSAEDITTHRGWLGYLAAAGPDGRQDGY